MNSHERAASLIEAANSPVLLNLLNNLTEWESASKVAHLLGRRDEAVASLKLQIDQLIETQPDMAASLLLRSLTGDMITKLDAFAVLASAEVNPKLALLIAGHPELVHLAVDPYRVIDSTIVGLQTIAPERIPELASNLTNQMEQSRAWWRWSVWKLEQDGADPTGLLANIPLDAQKFRAFQAWILAASNPAEYNIQAVLEQFTDPTIKAKAAKMAQDVISQ